MAELINRSYQSGLLTLGQLKQQLKCYKDQVKIEQYVYCIMNHLSRSLIMLNQTANEIDKTLLLGRTIVLMLIMAHFYLIYGHVEIVIINVFWIGVKLSGLSVLTNSLNCYLGNFYFAIDDTSCCEEELIGQVQSIDGCKDGNDIERETHNSEQSPLQEVVDTNQPVKTVKRIAKGKKK